MEATAKTTTKTATKTQKRIKRMVIFACIALATLIILSPILFFASIASEWQTRKDIKAVSRSLHIQNSLDELNNIAKNDRILEILAVDKDGKVLFTLKNMALFSDPNATVLYDTTTGLVKFDGGRISYFQRDSILGSLLDVDDDDFDYDDDDDRIPAFDYKFVEDNVYQTIALNDNEGNVVYIVCTRDNHVGLILYIVFMSLLWLVGLIYIVYVVGYVTFKKFTSTVCHACGEEIRRGNNHCTKCGVSLLPKMCENCGMPIAKEDKICGECGTKVP